MVIAIDDTDELYNFHSITDLNIKLEYGTSYGSSSNIFHSSNMELCPQPHGNVECIMLLRSLKWGKNKMLTSVTFNDFLK